MTLDTELILTKGAEIILEFGPKLISAILVLIVGLWVVKLLVKGFNRLMEKSSLDDSLKPFLRSLVRTILRILLVLTALSTLGVEMTSFVAILGAAGLAVGMALSGTLQNFAGGVIILIFKPFKVGDFIEAQGYSGTVNSIQIFNTVLKTPDNKTIIIPNGGLSTGSMINYNEEATRRVDWVFGIAYGDDYDRAESVIRDMMMRDDRVLKDPEVFIALKELADSSVNLVVRAWVNTPDYWGVFFDTNQQVYKEFPKHGLNIPFPQVDVHMHQNSGN
ncbi:MAG: mechanosensitive ion channel [Flavobacteriales bacterium]|nr:mechanosensitive ion channel [Bacteroidota bacterium]MCB9239794.1 mechanosensitive ion channel [Flavobacteriales bacterium]